MTSQPFLRHHRSDQEDGASAVEYGLLIAAIAAAIIIIIFAVGELVDELFTDTCDEIKGSASVSATCSG